MTRFPNGLRLMAVMFPFIGQALGQYPGPVEGGLATLSLIYEGASLWFKETEICETTEGVKGYGGYVNIPASEGRDYDINTWFWYFEARQDPKNAPLSLWIQGGPGAPTSTSAVGENGPCGVLPNSKDTELNPWSWNDRVNMLYIDQPVQTGFSYDSLVNGTINEVENPFAVDTQSNLTNSTILAGTFSSQNFTAAPNTTASVAPAMWQFMQLFMEIFPGYSGPKDKFSIWTESYGGHYGPTFADYFYKQNERIASGKDLIEGEKPLYLDTLGLVNACLDIGTQAPQYPVMAVNNTYDIRVFNDSEYALSMNALPQCLNLTAICRQADDELDPEGWGNNTQVNDACEAAFVYCLAEVAREGISGAMPTPVFHFDIATPAVHSFPPRWAAGYLNQGFVQQALGVPLNFTGNSDPVATQFETAGDFMKGHNLDILGQLLDRGVKVALMYGDRDYQCNWFGGEAVSLAVKSNITSGFHEAGYTNLDTNASYVGGAVRQHGNFSFTRVYQSGHEVAYYQPETAYQIFNRVMFNQDVATGKTDISDSYSTTGANTSLTGEVQVPIVFEEKAQCYFWDMMETCTSAENDLAASGSAIWKDWLLVGYKAANGTGVYFGGSGSGVNGTVSPTPSPYLPENGVSSLVPQSALLAVVFMGLQLLL